MNIKLISLNLILVTALNLLTVNTGLFGQVDSVIIGNQMWMKKNLEVDHFRNGETIPEIKDAAEWAVACKERRPAWCHYANDAASGALYGKLYNWYAVADSRELCPEGWHLPSEMEWTKLIDHLGGEITAGTQMKSIQGWEEFEGKVGNGSDVSGFSGLPGGYRNSVGKFRNAGRLGYWWASSEYLTYNAWIRYLSYNFGFALRFNFEEQVAISVRCIRD